MVLKLKVCQFDQEEASAWSRFQNLRIFCAFAMCCHSFLISSFCHTITIRALKGNKSTAATRRDCHQLLSAVFATGNICCQGFQHFVQVLSSLFTHFVVCVIRFNVCLFLSHRFNCLWLEKHVHLEVIPLSSVFVYPRPQESESSMVCCHQFWTSVQLHWTTQFYKISGKTNFGPVMENLMSANAQCGSSVDEAKC